MLIENAFAKIMTRIMHHTVSQQWLQPKSDGKRNFFAESFLRHPYINIYILAKNIHRALFEKVGFLEAENALLRVHYKMSFFMGPFTFWTFYVTLILMINAEIIQIILSNNKKGQHIVAEFSIILHQYNFWFRWPFGHSLSTSELWHNWRDYIGCGDGPWWFLGGMGS